MNKKFIVLTVVIGILLTVAVSGTLAWIMAVSNPVENTFTVGNVQITLTETTGDQYKMIPGVAVDKDPTVTVKAGSDACWLFVKIEKSPNFDAYLSFLTEDGWNALVGEDGVYYRQVGAAATSVAYSVLRYNHVVVKDTLTEAQLNSVSVNPTLTFSAYAIQQTGFSTAELAWNELNG